MTSLLRFKLCIMNSSSANIPEHILNLFQVHFFVIHIKLPVMTQNSMVTR